MGVWSGFRLKEGGWSCQLLIARSSLAAENSTIPKNELQALCSASNLGWTVERSLDDWVDEKVVASDSTIALSWAMSETKPLAMFHKNRVIEILRGTKKEQLYHVRTEVNAADVGTRPEKLKIEDMEVGSVWQNGYPWMKQEIDQAVSMGHIKPASELRMNPEEEDDFDKGLVFEKVPEILTRGHTLGRGLKTSLKKIQERAAVSKYLLLPTTFSFRKVVRIYSTVFSFITKVRKGRKTTSRLLAEGSLVFRIFVAHRTEVEGEGESGLCNPVNQKPGHSSQEPRYIMQAVRGVEEEKGVSMVSVMKAPTKETDKGRDWASTQVTADGRSVTGTDRFVNLALLYLYRKAMEEVKAFHSQKTLEKIAIEV